MYGSDNNQTYVVQSVTEMIIFATLCNTLFFVILDHLVWLSRGQLSGSCVFEHQK
jgi:hypothetical protein